MAASGEFTIPKRPEELEDEDCTYGVRAARVTQLAELPADQQRAFYQGVLYDLSNESALGITEPAVFEKVYSLAKGFLSLDGMGRKRLIDSLCSNLSVLSVSAGGLLLSDDSDKRDEAAGAHLSALKAYTFLLWWVASQAEQEHRASQPPAGAAAPAGRGGRARRQAEQAPGGWDWEAQREKLVRSCGGSAEVDLWQLSRPASPDARLLQKWLQLASLVLESAPALRNRAVKEGAFRMLAAAALRYNQLDVVAGALVDLLSKQDHLAPALAELAEWAGAHYGGDARLGVQMLREVAAVDPLEYDQQQKDDSGGVRNVAAFVQELAERLPREVAAHASLLMPHLGGKAHSLRSAIVTAVGHLILGAYAGEAPEGEADAQGAAARLRSKQHLLGTLLERARDQSAYTRARVMQTWAALAAGHAIDMGHWVCVTELAIGRLEDKSALVRKAALGLLAALLSFNPFAPQLPEAQFAATLAQYRAKLQELQPEAKAEAADPVEREVAVTAEGEAAAQLQAGGATDGAAAAQPQADGATDMETEQEAGGGSGGGGGGSGGGSGGSQQPPSSPAAAAAAGELARLRTTVACMDTAVGFIRALQGALGTLTQLLASATLSDVTEAVTLLVTCDRFAIGGSRQALRRALPLVFSREPGVRDALLGAIDQLHLAEASPTHAAERLIELADGLTIGEVSALEEVVRLLLSSEPPLLRPPVLTALWQLCGRALPCLPGEPEAAQQLAGGLSLLSMAAPLRPATVTANLELLLQVLQRPSSCGAAAVRAACACLAAADSLSAADLARSQRALAGLLLARGALPQGAWFSAAEAAVRAVFALHPAPAVLTAALLRRMAGEAFASAGEGGEASEGALARFFSVLGQAGLQQLVHVERTAAAVRTRRLAAEKAAAEAAVGGSGGSEAEDGGIAEVAAAAGDADLDSLKEAAEAQLAGGQGLVGRFAGLAAQFCHSRALLSCGPQLRGAALLALTKLMALDAGLCDANLQLLFTLLQNRSVEPGVRSNLVIAIGDLAFRFPNLLEPWTPHMYRPLADADKGVVKNSLAVLSHLILNDMMKVRSHVASLALLLRDPCPRIAAMAQLFFHELARKTVKGTNPVYNLLPDILSSLGSERGLEPAGFQEVMRHLLQYVGKDRHADGLADKLCARFGSPPEGASERAHARNLAFCLAQLNFTEKGVRRLMELAKSYQAALADDEVVDHLRAVLAKARKLPKATPEFRADVDAFEARLLEWAAERKEDEATAKAAQERNQPKQAAAPAEEAAEGEEAQPMEQGSPAAAAEPAPDAPAAAAADAEAAVVEAEAAAAEAGGDAAESGDSDAQAEAAAAETGTAISEAEASEESAEPAESEADSAAAAAAAAAEAAKEKPALQLREQLGRLALDAQESGEGASARRSSQARRSSLRSTGAKARASRSSFADENAGASNTPAQGGGGPPAKAQPEAGQAQAESGAKAAAAESAGRPRRGVAAMRDMWEQRASQ